MIERDYLMRILKQFFDVLQNLINNIDPNEEELFEGELNELCERFLGNDISFYVDNENGDLLGKLGDGSDRDLLARATMLAELLYYRLAHLQDDCTKVSLSRKVLVLLNFINEHSDTYSFERLSRIAELEQMAN